MDCIFCKIAKKEIPSKIVFENDRIMAFRDINPEAPVHVLIIPKKHISGIGSAQDPDAPLLGEIQCVARDLAKQEGIEKSGFRVVANNGPDAGQAVAHLHYHLLGGRKFKWPPG
jgi:histidine triad (HIT) family protein